MTNEEIPIPGEVYRKRDYSYQEGNPFVKPSYCHYKVIAVKDGFIKYKPIGLGTYRTSNSLDYFLKNSEKVQLTKLQYLLVFPKENTFIFLLQVVMIVFVVFVVLTFLSINNY